jgi:putative MATE family efflux protein
MPNNSHHSPNAFRRLWSLAAPVIGLNVLNVMALAVDTAMCGRLPDADEALTALSFATQVVFLLMVAMLGLTVGTVATLARSYGAQDIPRAHHIIYQSTVLTVALGLITAAIGLLTAPSLLNLLGATPGISALAMQYLNPILLAIPFSYLTILYGSMYRALGNTRTPFWIALFGNGLNVLCNYAFILGNWGCPSLGLPGAAIGTVAYHVLSILILFVLLRRGHLPGIKPSFSWQPLDPDLLKQLVRVGLPAAADMVILNASFLSIVGMLGRIDEAAVAGHGVGLRIQALAFIPGLSISQATSALVGKSLGAGNIADTKSILRASILMSSAMMTCLAIPIIFFAEPIAALFQVPVSTPVGAASVTWMKLLGYGMPVVGIYIAFVGLLQGAGATRISLAINSFVTLLFQIPASYILGFPLGLGAWGVWAAFPCAFVLKALLGWGAFLKESWWARVGVRV